MATPYSNDINDFSIFSRGSAGEMGLATLRACLTNSTMKGNAGRIMNFGIHPHVMGLPHRVGALREFLKYVKGREGVWYCSREELARWYLANHEGHIAGQKV